MLTKDTRLKTKRYDFSLQNAVVTKDASGDCIIQGYANTASKDRVGDVVYPKAFEKTLETYMKNPVLLANHDWNDPCGVVLEARIDDKGLWIKAKVSNTREDIKTLVKEGCLRTFSIGYNEIDADYDESTKTKYIKELELLEISIVTVPANAEAMFTVADHKAESAPEKQDDQKSAAPSRSAADLLQFIDTVKSGAGRDLEKHEVDAISTYFVETNEETMKTVKQLIEALSKKDASAVAAPVAPEAKAEEAAAPAEAQPTEGKDQLADLTAKIDMLAEAMSQLLQMVDAQMGGKTADEESEEKPAEEAAEDEEAKSEAAAEEEEDEEEPSEEEVQKQIAAVEAEIAALEDAEEL